MEKPIVLLLLAILLTSAIAESARHATAQADSEPSDSGTLYAARTSGGGASMSTETWYLGHCEVWVDTIISKSHANGFERNNPDGSFYPGDGFAYSFVYGWAGDPTECRNLAVCPMESHKVLPESLMNCDYASKMHVSKIASTESKTYSVSGHAELPADEYASGHYIKLQVGAERWACHRPRGAPVACGWSPISSVGMFAPSVLKPDVGLSLSHEHINDIDGYASANLDGTYYLWDAINIVHNPVYKWKKERVGTLSVAIHRTHDLSVEREFQCVLDTCRFTLTRDGFEPWSRQYEYGGGVTLYNATRSGDIKRQQIDYRASLYNLDNLIHRAENRTYPLVVVYDPVYEAYPYLVLKDEQWWSWSNRQAVVFEYGGSVGGGPDDREGIQKERRSKINHHVYAGYAFNPILQVPLNQSLSWSEANTIASPLAQDCFEEEFDPASFEANKKSAMFVKAGYGKIAFSYPILKTMLEKRYINATVENTVQSTNFAGYKAKNLTGYTYQYPDVKFANTVKILTYHSDGTRTGLPISITLIPDEPNGAQYTQDYTCNKILHDTKNTSFADIVVSEMYGRNNQGAGRGHLNLKTLVTSTWFPPFYSVLERDVMDLPLHEGYKALSPYEIAITVGEKNRTINRIVSFLSPLVHIVNVDDDNILNVTERLGFVKINPDEKFGDIVRVAVNGMSLNEDCTSGCATTIGMNEDLEIEAWNIWDGRAYAYVKRSGEHRTSQVNIDAIMVALTAILVGLLAWRFSGQILSALGLKRC